VDQGARQRADHDIWWLILAGLFITFEGGEGAGKSTQVQRLADHFRETRRKYIVTREPGGTGEAESIRALLVSGATDRWSANAEALLNYAAREMHLLKLIRPALARGDIVICDRFMDSTRAYQFYAGQCSVSLVDELEREIVGKTRPGLTMIFDLDPVIGLERARSRGEGSEDRFERKGLGFHQRLRDGFLTIARADPQRCKVIDASATVDAIATVVQEHAMRALNG
jgi:dTMP kinase